MKNNWIYLLYQIARFGALTASQMKIICAGKFKERALYDILKMLVSQGYIVRVTHPRRLAFAYQITEAALPKIRQFGLQNLPVIKQDNLFHTLKVAQVLIEMSHYFNVEGIASECELESESISRFCHLRRPDAIIQIKRPDLTFELAVEVETSLKTKKRVEEILVKYQKTFTGRLLCSGVVVVTGNELIYGVYQEQLSDLPLEFTKRVLLIRDHELNHLSPTVFGNRCNLPAKCLQSVRTDCSGGIRYIPIQSTIYISDENLKSSHMRRSVRGEEII